MVKRRRKMEDSVVCEVVELARGNARGCVAVPRPAACLPVLGMSSAGCASGGGSRKLAQASIGTVSSFPEQRLVRSATRQIVTTLPAAPRSALPLLGGDATWALAKPPPHQASAWDLMEKYGGCRRLFKHPFLR
jgi:hypothetical protein